MKLQERPPRRAGSTASGEDAEPFFGAAASQLNHVENINVHNLLKDVEMFSCNILEDFNVQNVAMRRMFSLYRGGWVGNDRA